MEAVKKEIIDLLEIKLQELEEKLENTIQERCDKCRDQAKADLNVSNKFFNDRLAKTESGMQKQISETRTAVDNTEKRIGTELVNKKELEVTRSEFKELIKAQDDSIDGVLTSHNNDIKTLKEHIQIQAIQIAKLEELLDRRVTTQTNSTWGSKIKIPTYEGSSREKPMSYLSQLESYFQTHILIDSEKLLVVSQGLAARVEIEPGRWSGDGQEARFLIGRWPGGLTISRPDSSRTDIQHPARNSGRAMAGLSNLSLPRFY